jgi:hypothetical protein
MATEISAEHDLYQLVNGHDVAAVLGIALRKVLVPFHRDYDGLF